MFPGVYNFSQNTPAIMINTCCNPRGWNRTFFSMLIKQIKGDLCMTYFHPDSMLFTLGQGMQCVRVAYERFRIITLINWRNIAMGYFNWTYCQRAVPKTVIFHFLTFSSLVNFIGIQTNWYVCGVCSFCDNEFSLRC